LWAPMQSFIIKGYISEYVLEYKHTITISHP
jgi:hypothetical protein